MTLGNPNPFVPQTDQTNKVHHEPNQGEFGVPLKEEEEGESTDTSFP